MNNVHVRSGFIRRLTYILVLFSACIFNSCKLHERGYEPSLILISFDGFRWDYMDKADTPNMDFMVQNGVKAEGLIPVFLKQNISESLLYCHRPLPGKPRYHSKQYV